MAGTTPFSAMTPSAVGGWLVWCDHHDWSDDPRKAWFDMDSAEIVTYGSECRGDDCVLVEARHKTPAELKAWAGY